MQNKWVKKDVGVYESTDKKYVIKKNSCEHCTQVTCSKKQKTHWVLIDTTLKKDSLVSCENTYKQCTITAEYDAAGFN